MAFCVQIRMCLLALEHCAFPIFAKVCKKRRKKGRSEEKERGREEGERGREGEKEKEVKGRKEGVNRRKE